jgi:two-component system response regulator NreC
MHDGDVEVVAQTSPGDGALTALEETHADLLVTEVTTRNGELDAPAYIREARERSPDTRIIVLAAGEDMHAVHDVLAAGASAYVVKTAPPEDLLAAVRQTFDGSVFMVPA